MKYNITCKRFYDDKVMIDTVDSREEASVRVLGIVMMMETLGLKPITDELDVTSPNLLIQMMNGSTLVSEIRAFPCE